MHVAKGKLAESNRRNEELERKIAELLAQKNGKK